MQCVCVCAKSTQHTEFVFTVLFDFLSILSDFFEFMLKYAPHFWLYILNVNVNIFCNISGISSASNNSNSNNGKSDSGGNNVTNGIPITKNARQHRLERIMRAYEEEATL